MGVVAFKVRVVTLGRCMFSLVKLTLLRIFPELSLETVSLSTFFSVVKSLSLKGRFIFQEMIIF